MTAEKKVEILRQEVADLRHALVLAYRHIEDLQKILDGVRPHQPQHQPNPSRANNPAPKK